MEEQTKVVSFFELPQLVFSLSDIAAIRQTPVWSFLSSMGDAKGRVLNGFLLIESGECRYEWDGGSADLAPGSLIYLPEGSRHRVTVTGRPFAYYRLSFRAVDAQDKKRVIFTDRPWPVAPRVGKAFFDTMAALVDSTLSATGFFRSASLLHDLFFRTERLLRGESKSRVAPALAYIGDHVNQNTGVTELAQMCFLSEPHFYRLFKREVGLSPVDYRNRLRVEKAKRLLSDKECSVSEIARLLGFENLYYFDRVFRKYTGCSPRAYREK